MSGVAIRVLIVDDQAMVRTGFKMIVDAEPDMIVVGEAATGRTAIDEAQRLAPDVVLMDIQMPELDGLAAAEAILAHRPETKILVLTTFERDDYIFDALAIGAGGFMIKNAPPEDLLDGIRLVAAGDALLSPSVTRRVIGAFVGDRPSPPSEPPAALASLTEREREVLEHVAAGLSNAEIAAALYLGEATIKTHVSSVLSKLGLRDRVQAVVFAFRHGVVTTGS